MKSFQTQKLKKLWPVLIPVLAVCVGVAVFSVLPKSGAVRLEGSVEIATTPLLSQVGGTVAEILVETGAPVQAGDLLAKMDTRQIQNEIEQLETALIIKTATLQELRERQDSGALDAAKNASQNSAAVYEERLRAAKRTLSQAQADCAVQQALYDAGTISRQALTQAESAVAAARSGVSIAQSELAAALDNVDALGPTDQGSYALKAAQADVRLTELQIQRLQLSLEDHTITAPAEGVVIKGNLYAGSTVVPGQELFLLSKGAEQYFVCYVPEDLLETIAFGSTLELYRFNSDEPLGTATICYIDWQAVYTPKDFASSANKNQKSVKVKALISSQAPIGVGEALITKLERPQ